MSVCSLCIWKPYMQMQRNFSWIFLTSRKRSTSTFIPKKIDPSPATGRSMLLTNHIIAFHSTKEVLLVKAAEGRLSAHLQQFTCSICLQGDWKVTSYFKFFITLIQQKISSWFFHHLEAWTMPFCSRWNKSIDYLTV